MPHDLRTRVKRAATQLKADGHLEHAAAVEAILAPGGWTKLIERDKSSQGRKQMSVNVPQALSKALKDAADRLDVTLSATVDAGFQQLIAREWTPPRPQRAGRGARAGVTMVTLNVTADAALWQQVSDMLPSLAEELEVNRVSLGHIAVSWLREELGVEDD